MSEKSISDIVDEHERTDLYMAIINALSKQIPKAVIVKHQEYKELIAYGTYKMISKKSHHCPVCDATVFSDFTQSYCDNCGQKLDWRALK